MCQMWRAQTKSGTALDVEIGDAARGAIGVEERVPSRLLLALQSRAPAEDGEVVGAVAEAAAIEVVEGQSPVLVLVRVVALKVAVADAALEILFRQRLDGLLHGAGEPLEVVPVFRTLRQDGLDEAERSVDQVIEIDVESSVRALEVVERVVHRGDGRAVATRHGLWIAFIGQLAALGESEQSDAARPLGRSDLHEEAPVPRGDRVGDGDPLAVQMIEHIELVERVFARSPAVAIGAEEVDLAVRVPRRGTCR